MMRLKVIAMAEARGYSHDFQSGMLSRGAVRCFSVDEAVDFALAHGYERLDAVLRSRGARLDEPDPRQMRMRTPDSKA